MRRLLVGCWLLLVSATLGCKSGQTWNWSPKQLFGTTTVPAPATTQFGNGAAAPYYQGSPPPAGGVAPPAGADPYAPPSGGFRSGQTDAVQPAARLVSVSPSAPAAAQRDAAVPLDEYAGRIREAPSWNDRVQPRPAAGAHRDYTQAAEGNNVRFVGESSTSAGPDPVERAFSDGSPRGRVAGPSTASIGPRSSVRLASAEAPEAPSQAAPAAEPARQRPAPFGHARDYSWLKGQLEPTADGQGWQLRYLPQGNRVDQYGGVMPLPASRAMEGFQAGEYIAVQGTVEHQDDGAGGFVPSYRLERIKPLEP